MNRNKDTLKDLYNRLTLQEQNNVIDFAYLYDDVRSLRHQLQQKENIIKEVREYIKKYRTMVDGYEDEKTGQMIYEHRLKLNKHQVRHLLEILDKGE